MCAAEIIVDALLSLKTSNSFSAYGSNSVVIWPILGKPSLLNVDVKKITPGTKITFELLVLTEGTKTFRDVHTELASKLSMIPLLGLNPKTNKAIEGEEHRITVEIVEDFFFSQLDTTSRMNNFLNRPLDQRERGLGVEHLPLTEDLIDFFCGRKQCFRIEGSITLSKSVCEYLKTHVFIMWNLMQTLPPEIKAPVIFSNQHPPNTRVLPHAICITRKGWDELTFIHATDLHISERNDEILGAITVPQDPSKAQKVLQTMNELVTATKYVTKTKIVPTLGLVKDAIKATISTKILKEAPSIKSENLESTRNSLQPDETQVKLPTEPLDQRFKNPNNYFRRLIRYANAEAAAGRLDFIVLTGDLIDFCIRADRTAPETDFDYLQTEWARFIDLIIHNPLTNRGGVPFMGIEPSEELLVPLFTILGNHDYRASCYSILTMNNYRHFGLQLDEALKYRDLFSSKLALMPSKNIKQAYYQYINPYDNYFLKLGSNTLIFLDSGFDSVRNVQYLLMGDPTLNGFSNEQLDYLRNLERHVITPYPEGYIFLFSHAPILNPSLRPQMGLLQKLHKIPVVSPEIFMETSLYQQDMKETRSDLDLDYHTGVIGYNWGQTIAFIDRNKAIALNGHTHRWREFRTKSSPPPSNLALTDPQPETPFAIYWDAYTSLHHDHPDTLEKLLPLHLQTPALGFDNDNMTHPPGGIRTIQLKQNHVQKLEVSFLD